MTSIFDLFPDAPEEVRNNPLVEEKLPKFKDESYLQGFKEYGKSALKGTVEGLGKLGRIIGPLQDYEGRSEKQIEEQTTEGLDKLLPTEEGYGQSSLRRGLREAPTMLAFPGSKLAMLPRSIAAGFLGEGAKELGLPEWAETAAELTAYIGPDLTKKLLQTGSNAEIIKTAKKFGLSDEQISPLIQSDFKQKWLSKLVPKRGRTEKILSSTKEGLGEAYGSLRKSPGASIRLNPEQQSNLLKKFGEIGLDIPSSVRNEVALDFADLVKKPITGASLLNLHKDINKALGSKTKELSRFKEPIREALKEISPELADDFSKINELYSRYSKIAPKLKPDMVSDLIRAAESLGLMGSIIYGEPTLISKFLAEKGIRWSARELLLNPRLQQLTEKTLVALNQNKYGLAVKLMAQVKEAASKIDDRLAEGFPDLSEEDLKELFPD
jgi:hypothetical protein